MKILLVIVICFSSSLIAQDFRFITNDRSHPLPAAHVGVEYFGVIEATGGNGPYFFFANPETPLPSGLELFPNGVINGVPEESGNKQFYIQVLDSSVPQTQRITQYLSINFSDTMIGQEAKCSLDRENKGCMGLFLVALFLMIRILFVKIQKTC